MVKTLNTLALAAAVLASALSCGKSEAPEPTGRPLTVMATIGGEESKTTYTPEGNMMKVEWEASESISVISVDASGNVKTIDTFTYSGAPGKSATFTGTLSPGATDQIMVLYPALEAYTASEYGTPLPEGMNSSYMRLVSEVGIGYPDAKFDAFNRFTQASDGSTAHLKGAMVLEGAGTVSSSELEVKMKHLGSVLRLDMSFSSYDLGKEFDQIVLLAFDSEDNEYNFQASGWVEYFAGAALPAAGSQASVFTGSWSGSAQTPLAVSGTSFTAYVPFLPGAGALFGPSGARKIRVELRRNGSTVLVTNGFPGADVALEPGNLYRATVMF